MEESKEVSYKVEYRPGTAWNQREGAMYKYMECRQCGQCTGVSEDTIASTCYQCVSDIYKEEFGESDKQSNKPSGFHRGWRWMKEFVHVDGRVFHKGEEQIELKGTLSATEIKERLRLKSKQKEDLKRIAGANLHKLKKTLDKTRWKKDKKPIMRDIRYYSRLLKGKFSQEDIQKYLDGYFYSS